VREKTIVSTIREHNQAKCPNQAKCRQVPVTLSFSFLSLISEERERERRGRGREREVRVVGWDEIEKTI
jgi:hypothetical protein